MLSLAQRRSFTFGRWGKGAAGPTYENMNRFAWGSHTFWAREDKNIEDDFKIDGARTYKASWNKPKFFMLGKIPGDATPHMQYRLDGWEHKNDGNGGIGVSRLRIPETVDQQNWRPVTVDEQDLFDKRREHHVKNRRKFWTMRYNPKTETYFKEQWSDRTVAQFEWSNSGWFRMTANQWWTSSYWLTNSLAKFFGTIFVSWWYMRWHQHNSTAGRIWAPATDMENWEIQIVDMTRNNYTTIGEYRNGEFRPFNATE